MKELKLIILQGVPASGKSTWAREQVTGKKDIVLVNRDAIRDSLGDYWIPEREDLVTSIEVDSINSSLLRGYNVIVDATNLNPKTIKKWEGLVYMFNQANADKCHVTIEKKFFDISLEEAISRDMKRERSVGREVITDFFSKYVKSIRREQKVRDESTRYYLDQDPSKAHCIIVDIDGTVALMKGRSPYDLAKVSTDVPNIPVIAFILNYLKGNIIPVNFVSGREDICREDTIAWIKKNFPYSACNLYMRKAEDFRSDFIVKEEIFHEHIEPYFYVEAVFDDKMTVVKTWRSMGLLTFQVYNGDF